MVSSPSPKVLFYSIIATIAIFANSWSWWRHTRLVEFNQFNHHSCGVAQSGPEPEPTTLSLDPKFPSPFVTTKPRFTRFGVDQPPSQIDHSAILLLRFVPNVA